MKHFFVVANFDFACGLGRQLPHTQMLRFDSAHQTLHFFYEDTLFYVLKIMHNMESAPSTQFFKEIIRKPHCI